MQSILSRLRFRSVWPLLILAIVVSRTGDVLLKFGVGRAGGLSFQDGMVWSNLVAVFGNPLVLLALSLTFGGAILWLAVLGRADLSWALPLLSLGYIFVGLAGMVFLGEHLSMVQWLGIGIICAGVMWTARS